MGPRPERPHGGDVLVIPRAATFPGNAEGIELLLQPADAQAQLHPAARELVQCRQLLGKHQGIALRHDQDAGSQPQRRRRRGGERQPNKRIRNRRIRLRRYLAICCIGILRCDRIRQHHMFPAPNGLEAGALRTAANLQSCAAVDANAACEGKSYFHKAPFLCQKRPYYTGADGPSFSSQPDLRHILRHLMTFQTFSFKSELFGMVLVCCPSGASHRPSEVVASV